MQSEFGRAAIHRKSGANAFNLCRYGTRYYLWRIRIEGNFEASWSISETQCDEPRGAHCAGNVQRNLTSLGISIPAKVKIMGTRPSSPSSAVWVRRSSQHTLFYVHNRTHRLHSLSCVRGNWAGASAATWSINNDNVRGLVDHITIGWHRPLNGCCWWRWCHRLRLTR